MPEAKVLIRSARLNLTRNWYTSSMRNVEFAEGELYHIYNRGVDKRTIFTSHSEYERFLAYLYLLNTEEGVRPADIFDRYSERESMTLPRGLPLVAIGAYCLMPNHIHLLATPLKSGGISKFMQRVQTAYTMFFNLKHQRTGALFQGTFKAAHVDRDSYARYLYSYIHLNPAKLIDPRWKEFGPSDFGSVREFVRSYRYSSLSEYLAGIHTITDPSKLPSHLAERKDIDEHIEEWLRYHAVCDTESREV